MEINQEIIDTLKEFKINRDAGMICLLGIYHGYDVDTVIDEEIVKSIAITKIVDRDYEFKTIKWNIPLFAGEETSFAWVKDWIDGFGKINMERKGAYADALTRMKVFFSKYPQYRKDDVYKARDMYFSTIKDSKFLMKSHKFIFDGIGAMKKSTLLEYCEKVVTPEANNSQMSRVGT